MKFVAPMIDRVVSNGYKVKAGDTVGSIAAGFTGSPLRCVELVGANFHKRIIKCNGLDHYVFSTLTDGEELNIPDDWSDAPNVSVGVSGGRSGMIGQTDAIGSVLANVIATGSAIAWPAPANPAANVGGMLAQWWPYLQAPPNSYSLPDASNFVLFMQWLTGSPSWYPTMGFPNTPNKDMFAQLIAMADRWVTQFSVPAQPVQWDSVPWGDLSKIFSAFGGDKASLKSFLQMLSQLSAPMGTAISPSLSFRAKSGAVRGTPSCPNCSAPKFAAIDPRDEPFITLVNWFATWPTSGVNPADVPWDIASDPQVLACISANPSRVSEMKADSACFPKVPAACGDAKIAFKQMLCATTYTPGWCGKCGSCLGEGKMPCSASSDCCAGLECINSVCRKHGYVTPTGGNHGNQNLPGANGEGEPCQPGYISCEAGLECINGVCSKPGTVTQAKSSTSPLVVIAATIGVAALAFAGYKAMQPKKNPVGAKRRKSSGEVKDTSAWGIEQQLFMNRKVTGRSRNGYFIRAIPDSTEPGYLYQVLISPSAHTSLQRRYSEDVHVIAEEFVGSLSNSHPVKWEQMPDDYGYRSPVSKFAGMGHLED